MLAQALTSENKTQGNFGELRLRQLLEQMGLERGVQYEEQVTLRNAEGQTATDEEGHRLIPDVILHFPDERDVIIDSKVSLTAFEDYFHASSDEEKAAALRRHVSSMRSHVYELSRKNYSQYIREGRHRLDFVLMYVFSESALQLALGADAKLWRDAYDKGVIIAGSQSLFIMLRVLEMSWKQMRQFENQQDIMRQANLLIDRVQLFYERFLKVDEQLHRTQEAFDELRRSTAPNGLSITTAATRLLKYGAQENPKRRRHLPKAEDDVEEEDSQE
jgi:DNA recombination protein RmuC